MKTVSLSLSNTNYTEQAAMDIHLESEEFALLKKMFEKIEDGLYRESASYMSVEGLSQGPFQLTITEYQTLADTE